MARVSVEGKGFKKIDGANLEYEEGRGTHLVVKLLRNSDKPLSVRQIASVIGKSKEGKLLIKMEQVQDIGERVEDVVSWLRSKQYITEEGDMIALS
jgi:hypothetical protein